MSLTVLQTALRLTAWGVALLASLSIAQWPGDWGHGVCGPWGCGPPMQALVACHLAWLVMLAPLGVFSATRVTTAHRRGVGLAIAATACVLLAVSIGYERATWWPAVSEFQQGFFWQRCAFRVATLVELPIAQLFVVGLGLAVWPRRRPARQDR